MDSKFGSRAPVGGGLSLRNSNAITIVMFNHYPAMLYSLATPSSKLGQSPDNEKEEKLFTE